MPPLDLTLPLDKPLRSSFDATVISPGSQTSSQPTSSQASGQTAGRTLFNEAYGGLNNAKNVKNTFIHLDVKDQDSPERFDQTCPARLSCHESDFPDLGVDDRLCSDETRVAESGVPSYVHTMACQDGVRLSEPSNANIGASSSRDRAATEVAHKVHIKNTFIDVEGSPANTTPAAARGATCTARLEGTQLANFPEMSPVSSNDAVFQSSWPPSASSSRPSPLSQPPTDQCPPMPAPAQQADAGRPLFTESLNRGSNTAGHGYGDGSGPQIVAKVKGTFMVYEQAGGNDEDPDQPVLPPKSKSCPNPAGLEAGWEAASLTRPFDPTPDITPVSPPAPGLALIPPISGGSAEHGLVGQDGLPLCRPCAWLFKGTGCTNGQSCIYCHLCPEGEIKRRKKLKIEGIRAVERQEKALQDSIAGVNAAIGPAPASLGGQPQLQHHAAHRPQGPRR